jgi:2-polyprenyl-3-methyl-5-hydroxy-6-metoxy-1,4-benzoquinol methylase
MANATPEPVGINGSQHPPLENDGHVQDGHVQVDFRGSRFLQTSGVGRRPNRLTWRSEVLLARQAHAIKGKRVLDLASHDGRFSHVCLALGARHVTGVEGRPHLVAHAKDNLSSLGYSADQYNFLCGDVFDHLESCDLGEYDTVLCLGLFYHIVRQVELLNQVRRIEPQYLILDSTVRKPPYTRLRKLFDRQPLRSLVPRYLFRTAYLQFVREDYQSDANTTEESGVVAIPTPAAVEMLLDASGFDWHRIDWGSQGITDWTGLQDYRLGKRVSYVGRPR